jgi:hypothetical protein
MRYAITYSDIGTVIDYLPTNYKATPVGEALLIYGEDDHGWGMSTYVIPRLASGLVWAEEITREEAKTLLVDNLCA